MKLSTLVRSRLGTLAAVGVVAILAGAGSAVAAGQITSAQIKDGTIQTGDLTKNNFARFTSTENVVTAQTAVSTNPAYGGARVVDITNVNTPVVTLVLDKGTWKLDGVGQFVHFTGSPGNDFGVVTVPGLQSGFAENWTSDVPDAGNNLAQTSFGGTIKITANDTPVVISARLQGGANGQAGVSVTATQYEYVKLFHGGQPA